VPEPETKKDIEERTSVRWPGELRIEPILFTPWIQVISYDQSISKTKAPFE